MSPHPDTPIPRNPTPSPTTTTETNHADDPHLEDLRLAILARIRHTLTGIDHLTYHLDRHGPHITVHLTGPTITRMRRNAIAVRILDAVRSTGHTYGHVDLDYKTRPDTGPPA